MSTTRARFFCFSVLALLIASALAGQPASAQSPAFHQGSGWWAKAAVYRQLDDTNTMWGQISNQSSPARRTMLCFPYDPVADVVGWPSYQIQATQGTIEEYTSHNIWNDNYVGLGGSDYSIVCFGSTTPFQNMIFPSLPILNVIRLVSVSTYNNVGGKVKVRLRVDHLEQGKSTATLKVEGPSTNQVLGTIAVDSTTDFVFTAPSQNGLTYTLYAKTTGGWRAIESFVVDPGCGREC